MASSKNKKVIKKNIKQATRHKSFLVVVLVYLVIAALMFGIIFLFGDKLVNKLNKNKEYGDIDFSVGLSMDVIDVGQGEAIFIDLPDGKCMLIDSGDRTSSTTKKFKDYIENKFKNRDKVLDYCMLTHPDQDHGGNMAWVFDYFEVKVAYRPNVFCSTVEPVIGSARDITDKIFFTEYVEKMLAEENCEIIINSVDCDDIVGENYKFTFYSPNKSKYTANNNYSPIMVLEYFGQKICLTGDAEELAEKEVLETIPACQVLSAGHHGSNSSTNDKFLNAIKPKYVLVSVGVGNRFGHPGDEFLKRVAACASVEKVLYTSEIGTISMFINEELAGKDIIYFAGMDPIKITIVSIYIGAYSILGGVFIINIFILNVSSKNKKRRKKS